MSEIQKKISRVSKQLCLLQQSVGYVFLTISSIFISYRMPCFRKGNERFIRIKVQLFSQNYTFAICSNDFLRRESRTTSLFKMVCGLILLLKIQMKKLWLKIRNQFLTKEIYLPIKHNYLTIQSLQNPIFYSKVKKKNNSQFLGYSQCPMLQTIKEQQKSAVFFTFESFLHLFILRLVF